MKTTTRKVPATTNNITKAIVNFLRSKRHSASRVNVQGQYDPTLGEWKPSGSRKGYFDISACIKDSEGVGRFVAIDIKKGNDKLSKDQKEFIAEVKEAGGVAIEVSSYPDFLLWYDNFSSETKPEIYCRMWDDDTCEELIGILMEVRRQDLVRYIEGKGKRQSIDSEVRERIHSFLVSNGFK